MSKSLTPISTITILYPKGNLMSLNTFPILFLSLNHIFVPKSHSEATSTFKMAYFSSLGPSKGKLSKKSIFDDFFKVFLIVPGCHPGYVGMSTGRIGAVSSP